MADHIRFADAPEDGSTPFHSSIGRIQDNHMEISAHQASTQRRSLDDAPPPPYSLTENEDREGEDFDDEYDDEEEYDSDDLREWQQNDDHRVDDEDWEIAEKDFTKQYNRLKQHNDVVYGTSTPTSTSKSTSTGQQIAILPAINRPKPSRGVAEQQDGKGTKEDERTLKKEAMNKRMTDQLTALSKFSSRIVNIDEPYRRSDADEIFQLGVSVNRKGPSSLANQKDKSDRATNEQVLDPRTRIILYKMIGRGLVKEINGCVSTGKEANVYHALTPTMDHLALKIYKTSILVFKDRDRYVTGEFRFRRGYSKHNPRKMVRLWAEKEMRNLKRLKAAGIRCPDVLEVRENVLVMEFIGDKEGWASPRLKDAKLSASAYAPLYLSLMHTVRTLYHKCKLVHADLSEYNILYHHERPKALSDQQPEEKIDAVSSDPAATPAEPTLPTEQDYKAEEKGPKALEEGRAHLYIIDVSQSVEHDHPSAFEFLRMDLKNVQRFFESWGVRCLGLKRAFEFVTYAQLGGNTDGHGEIDDDNEASVIEELLRWIEEDQNAPASTRADDEEMEGGEEGQTRLEEEVAALKATEDSVFLQSYIPRRMSEMTHPERVLERPSVLSSGQGKPNTGEKNGVSRDEGRLKQDVTNKEIQEELKEGEEERRETTTRKTKVRFGGVPDRAPGEESDEDTEGDEDEDEGEEEDVEDITDRPGFVEKKRRGHRHEDKEAKKERKKATKDEQREKRKVKMPKAEKKKLIKKSRGG
ncbi:protein kinase rio1 [Serendipita sp. 401]|nr:protein kinase rio1 [Serendipita sp. 401]